MNYLRLYADPEGESHWQEVTVDLAEKSFAPPAKAIEVSEAEDVAKMVFLKLKSGWDESVHTSPVAQTLICIAGCVRVTASDGEARDVGKGDVWRMEDLHGRGHHTRVVSDCDFEAVIVQS